MLHEHVVWNVDFFSADGSTLSQNDNSHFGSRTVQNELNYDTQNTFMQDQKSTPKLIQNCETMSTPVHASVQYVPNEFASNPNSVGLHPAVQAPRVDTIAA